MKSIHNIPVVAAVVLFCALLMLSGQAAADPPSMKGYCVQPPFLVVPKQPNVLIILDSSGSMNCLAYQSAYDPSQFTSGQYYGYFDPTMNYKYTTSASPTAANPNRWIPTTDAMDTGTAANPIASGNFLNWITMSRQDVAKKLLIGGRAATGSSSPGAYNIADRTTSPVKLYGDSDARTAITCTTNVKTHDTTGIDNLIYPFTDEYSYTVQTDYANTFTVTYDGPAIAPVKLYPNRNYPGSNPVYTFPTAWAMTPAGSPATDMTNAYDRVNETSANTSDYITNKTSASAQALFDFDRANADLLAAAAVNNPISSITVHAYARKTVSPSSTTVYLQGVLWMNIPLMPDSVQPSGLSALTTSFRDIPFDYPLNPRTNAPWQWSDFTTTTSATGPDRLKAFGVMATLASGANPTSTKYATVSQVYIQINVVTPPNGGPYKIIVDQGSTPATGILDSMSGEVRFGLANYNTLTSSTDGGKIADTGTTTPTYVDFGTVPNIIKTISDTVGSGGTPLAETLYEMVRYFRQDSPNYSSGDYKLGCANAPGSCSTSDVNTRDPYFYGGTINQYVPCTQSYILFLTDGESYGDQNLPGTSTTSPYADCSLTNIKNCSGSGTLPRPTRYGGTAIGQTYPNSGTDYMIDVAYWARTGDMRSGATSDLPLRWRPGLPRTQNIFLYTVFLFGSGSTLLQDAAIYGGFNDIDNTGKPDCTTKPEKCYRDSNGDGHIYSVRHNFCSNQAPTFSTTCATDADCGGGTCLEPDAPITYYEGDDGYRLEASITAALTEILKRSASGTAASVLASGEGSGANLLQAIFYPKRSISGQADILWTSTLQNFWYYLDPKTAASSIRENTADSGNSYELNLDTDYIMKFFFDSDEQITRANLFADSNADGLADSVTPTQVVDGSDIKSLWEAGLMLWKTSSAECGGSLSPPNCRRIYTNITDTFAASTAAFAGMTEFMTANRTGTTPTLQSLLNTNVSARTSDNNNTVANNIINYVRGADFASPVTLGTETITYRSRSTAIDLSSPKDGDFTDTGESSKVWKLGDIINSTPRVVSWIPLNTYHTTYNDLTYSSFINTTTYKGRGAVFAGANDGMLHAFTLGTLDLTSSGAIKAKLCEDTNENGKCESGETTKSNLGVEQWAFIPKNALPYLQYLAKTDYCHLYYADATPYVFDASIEAPGAHASDYWTQTKTSSSWRTVLIGSMRLGGACSGPSYCASTTTICSDDADCATGVACVRTANTVGAPAIGLGYSSYFALDVTNPTSPQLMWEFTNQDLGVASSGPAILKINARTPIGTTTPPTSTADKSKDGKWFVVLASGPTGPVGTSQFKAYSNQNLRLFVLDLKTGTLLRTIDTNIANAFGGSLNNANIDYDFDYQDDAMYLGYTKSEDATPSGSTRWNRGGVLRLVTGENLNGYDVSPTATNSTALNPASWQFSRVVDSIGPVTSSIAHLAHYPTVGKNPDKAYLYFGSGRYFYPLDETTSRQALYGVVEPCLAKIKVDPAASAVTICDENGGTPVTCTSTLGVKDAPAKDLFSPTSCLEDATSNATMTSAPNGWYITMEAPPDTGVTFSERMITDPVAAQTGVVFFTTFTPSTDICAYGGFTQLWAAKYDTAAAVGSYLMGKGLMQVSTGAISEIDLSTAFGSVTDAGHKFGRRTDAIDGVPPTGQGLSLVVPPKPINRMLHIKKR